MGMDVKFIGAYRDLKHIGFKFQKLYAMNYMQWHHEPSDIRIWKKGNDVTCNQYPRDTLGFLCVLLDENAKFTRYLNHVMLWYDRIDDNMTYVKPEHWQQGDWQEIAVKPETMLMLIHLRYHKLIQWEYY